MDDYPLVVQFALPFEFRRLRRRARRSEVLSRRPSAWRVELEDGLRVVAVVSGQGPARARRATEWSLRTLRPKALLAAGLAGGTRAGQQAGDLVIVDAAALGGDRDQPEQRLAADARLVQTLEAVLVRRGSHAVRGAAMQVAVVADPGGKRVLGQQGAAVVDMETHTILTTAVAADCPAAGLRAVLDPADREIPRSLHALSGLQGGRWFPEILGLWRLPFEAVAVFRFGRDLHTAQRSLGDALALCLPALDRALE